MSLGVAQKLVTDWHSRASAGS